MEKSLSGKSEKLDKASRPLHDFITNELPNGTFRSNQAWARLQESVNWALASLLEESKKDPEVKKKLKK